MHAFGDRLALVDRCESTAAERGTDLDVVLTL